MSDQPSVWERFHRAGEASTAWVERWFLGVTLTIGVIAVSMDLVYGAILHGDPLWYFWLPGEPYVDALARGFADPVKRVVPKLTACAAATIAYTLWATPDADRVELMDAAPDPDD